MHASTTSHRRFLAALLALLLLAAACGGRADNGDEARDDSSTGTTAKKQLVAGPGFDMTTIKVGALTPLTGPVAGPIGLPLTEGNKVYLEKVNAAGGIAGKYKL